MKINVESGDITQQDAKAIIVNLFKDVKVPGGATGAVDAALEGGISALINEGEIRGKAGETVLVHTLGRMPSPRVIIAGLGQQDPVNPNVHPTPMAPAPRRPSGPRRRVVRPPGACPSPLRSVRGPRTRSGRNGGRGA